MGRGKGKLKLELISNRKARESTFKRRNKNLVKKAKELTQLCGVDVCMIVYSPDHHGPVTLCGDIRGMVDLYRAKKVEARNSGTKCVRTFGVSDFHSKEQLPQTDVDEKAITTQLVGIHSEKPGELMGDDTSLFFDYGKYELYDPQQQQDQIGYDNSSSAPPLMLTMGGEDASSTDQKCCAVDFDVKDEFDDEYWAGGYVSQLCPPPQPVMLW